MKVDKTKWQKKTLGESCEIQLGSRIVKKQTEPGDYFVYGGGGATFTSRNYNREDAILVSRFALSPKCTRFIEGKFFLNDSGLTLLPKNDTLNFDFLKWHIFAINDKIYSLSRGSAQKNLDMKRFPFILLSIPLISDQKCIASELDAVQAMIDGYREQLSDLDALAQSIFLETFGDPIFNPKGWEIKQISDVTSSNTKGLTINEYNGKVWVLNLDKIESNSGNILSYDFVTKDEIGPSTFPFDNTMVLYSKLRPYLNKVVAPQYSGYATTELVPFIPKSGLDKVYFLYLLRNNSMVRTLNATSGGARMPRTKMETMKKMLIPLPPLSLQQQFASQVKAIEKQKDLLRQQIADAEMLMAERMQYYFS